MRISKTMIRDHLRAVTVNYFDRHDVHPTDVAEYAPLAGNVRYLAERQGDLPWLKLGLEYVLLHPERPCDDLNGGVYPFSNDQMRDLLEVIWETLWPNSPLPDRESMPALELVEMSGEEWQAAKAQLTPP